MKPPRIRGTALRALRIAAEAPGTAAAVREVMKASLGIDELARLPADLRGPIPLTLEPLAGTRGSPNADGDPRPLPSDEGWSAARSLATAADYVRAYAASDGPSPVDVVTRALSKLDQLAQERPCMNILCARDDNRARKEAAGSAQRYKDGKPLSPVDGVPFLVKDEYDVAGLPTRLGARAEPDTPAAADATIVARLVAGGAIVIGKTVLTEWGMSPLGVNAAERMPHNPHNPDHVAGGSSTGSAVGVALGLGPFATAGDGGGSIRIPACLNGIFGLKPTFGRVSRVGDHFVGSVAHCGPVAASTADLALFMDIVATELDGDDQLSAFVPPAPKGGFGHLLSRGVAGLRIALDESEWADADPAVAKACRQAVKELERQGAQIVDVDLGVARQATKVGYLTIGPESLAAVEHHFFERRELINDDLRVAFAVLNGISCREYLDAQRLRTSIRRRMAEVFSDVDLVALPTTATTAPSFVESEEGVPFSDPEALDAMCRYAFLGNLTGLPAGTAPVGRDVKGLPIGLQLVGNAWADSLVLAGLMELERVGLAVPTRPRLAVDLLS